MVFGLLLLGKILDPSEKMCRLSPPVSIRTSGLQISQVVFLVYFTVLLTHDVALASGKYTPLS